MKQNQIGEIRFVPSNAVKSGGMQMYMHDGWKPLVNSITMSRADIHHYLDECKCDLKQHNSKLEPKAIREHVIKYAENNLDAIELLHWYGFL